MNVKEYIASGIIESYVMGLATDSERTEFERYCTQYPELVAARKDFEEKLEKHASDNAEHPPVEVKEKVLEAIGGSDSRKSVSFIPPKQIFNDMENSTSSRGSGWSRLAAAASIILIVGLAWFGYQSHSENKDLAEKNSALTEKLNSTDSILNQIVAEQKVVKDPNVTVVNMVGTQVAPKSSANIYWDSTSSNVYLVVKNMPVLPSDKQYQLWALINGKPKDLGVFDASDSKVILQMKNTQKAQAFAITIEQKGGSPSPTLDKMQSLGKLQQSQ